MRRAPPRRAAAPRAAFFSSRDFGEGEHFGVGLVEVDVLAASFSSSSRGSKRKGEGPSRRTGLSVTRTRPSGRSWTRSWASGGAEEGAAELFEAGAIVGGDPDVGVEIDAVALGLAGPAGAGEVQLRLVEDVPRTPGPHGDKLRRGKLRDQALAER